MENNYFNRIFKINILPDNKYQIALTENPEDIDQEFLTIIDAERRKLIIDDGIPSFKIELDTSVKILYSESGGCIHQFKEGYSTAGKDDSTSYGIHSIQYFRHISTKYECLLCGSFFIAYSNYYRMAWMNK